MTWFEHADITYKQFQQRYWRKRPWHGENLFGNTLSNIDNELNNNNLFYLAGDPLIESRVISGAPEDYQLELGPFDIENLASGEMLMIQGLEQHLEVISDLLSRHFGFLPRWRINDVMASYGHSGASWVLILTIMTSFCSRSAAKNTGNWRPGPLPMMT